MSIIVHVGYPNPIPKCNKAKLAIWKVVVKLLITVYLMYNKHK